MKQFVNIINGMGRHYHSNKRGEIMSMGLVSKARRERKQSKLGEDRKIRDQNRKGWANIKIDKHDTIESDLK